MRPRSLFQFLRWAGGLRPHPDLTAILDGRHRLIRTRGMSLDQALVACMEERFLDDHECREHEPTINDLLDLIAAEAGGHKQYRVHEALDAMQPRHRYDGKEPGLIEAIKQFGSMRALAAALAISTPTVAGWRQVPVKYLLQIETASNIPRQRLRPDLFAKRAKLRRPTANVFGDAINAADAAWLSELVRMKDYRAHPRAPDWLGVEVAKHFGLDLNNPRDRLRICALLDRWVAAGVLREQYKRDPRLRKLRLYYVTGEQTSAVSANNDNRQQEVQTRGASNNRGIS